MEARLASPTLQLLRILHSPDSTSVRIASISMKLQLAPQCVPSAAAAIAYDGSILQKKEDVHEVPSLFVSSICFSPFTLTLCPF
jgi:hypothetical protein